MLLRDWPVLRKDRLWSWPIALCPLTLAMEASNSADATFCWATDFTKCSAEHWGKGNRALASEFVRFIRFVPPVTLSVAFFETELLQSDTMFRCASISRRLLNRQLTAPKTCSSYFDDSAVLPTMAQSIDNVKYSSRIIEHIFIQDLQKAIKASQKPIHVLFHLPEFFRCDVEKALQSDSCSLFNLSFSMQSSFTLAERSFLCFSLTSNVLM